MADKLILEVHVRMDMKDCSFMKGPAGEVVMIPFTGTAEGEIFHGVVRPGGVDTQRVNLSGVRHMSARYLLEGEDSAGEKCHIFIENNGWFETQSMPFKTVPTFMTDSRTLAPYLHRNKFRGEGHPEQGGVLIKLFEVDAPDA
jgi:hypothetical protein